MRGAGGGVQVFLCIFYGFFWVLFMVFLGLDCREPVTVSQKGLICVFLCIFYGFLGLGCREIAQVRVSAARRGSASPKAFYKTRKGEACCCRCMCRCSRCRCRCRRRCRSRITVLGLLLHSHLSSITSPGWFRRFRPTLATSRAVRRLSLLLASRGLVLTAARSLRASLSPGVAWLGASSE